MAEQVVKTFDYYNTTVLLPGYTVPGHEKELELSKNLYSTDFSSNPIGSKVDFFTHLNDPCIATVLPNPVFTVSTALSALSPQWFDNWWDQAMFYSHPKVLEQLKENSPSVYQDFSESVGSLSYVATEDTPVNPGVYHKIPNRILTQMNALNRSINDSFKAFTPDGAGASKNTLFSQIQKFTSQVTAVRGAITTASGVLKNKLPFAVLLVGNLITPDSWSHGAKIEGISTAVDRINNLIKAPGRMLSNALNKIDTFLSKIKLPKLPSLSKLMGMVGIPAMPAINNIISNIKAAASTVKSVVSTAQGAIATAGSVVAQVKDGVGSVLNTINTETQKVTSFVDATKNAAGSIQDLNKVVNGKGTTTVLKNQSNNALAGLNKNTAVIINVGSTTKQGNPSINKINTFKYPPNS